MNKYYLILLMLLPLLLCAASISVNVKLDMPNSSASGYGSISTAGAYQLPVKTLNVLLPFGATVSSWQVDMSGAESIAGTEPPRNKGFSNGEEVLNSAMDKSVMSNYSFLGTRKWGELSYASFSVVPGNWDGTNWLWHNSCNIKIDYTAPDKASGKMPRTYDKQDFFVNTDDMAKWYSATKDRQHEILVITTQPLFNAMSSWVAFRQSQGIVVSFTEIDVALANGTGSDDAARLRSYLQSQYTQNPFDYLLLVGDYDTVPIAFVTPEPDGMETVPTDFFYGDLSSNWDSDNDGRYGEYSSGFMNQDYLVDFTPEVYVGRISSNSISQVTAIANRIVSFEQNTGEWKNKNLLPAAFLNYLGEPETNMPQTDGALYMEFLRSTCLAGQANTSLYEQAGVVQSFPGDLPLTYENFRSKLNTESWGFINWSAHGSSSSSSRKVWMNDYNQNNMPEGEEMEWQNLVNRQSFDNLGNTDGTVIFAASCYNGMIDSNNTSLGEYALIKKAVGVFAATRTGWYKVGWLNPGWGGLSSYNYHLVENYRQSSAVLGAAHAYANLLHSQYYLFGDPIDSGGIIWPELQNIYTYLLYGDPLVGYTPEPVNPAGEILVWEPYSNDGLPVVNALRETTNMNVIYSDKLIVDYDYLNNFEAVFCLFGMPDGGEPVLPETSFEYGYLLNYLNNGGKLYIEGYLDWSSQSELWQMLGTEAPYSGVTHIPYIRHIASGMLWDYTAPDMYITMLEPYAPTAQPLFKNQNGQAFEPNIAIWNTNGSYRTVASSFLLSKVGDAEHSLTEMIGIICDTLNVINYQPVSNNDLVSPAMVSDIACYPNPASGLASLAFKVNNPTPVKVDIYNVKGQKVKSLMQDELKSGDYTLNWDLSDTSGRKCSSGIYFYRVQTKDRVQTAKQVIIH